MDITPQNEQQPISDDQELAKALAGVLPDVPEPVVPATPSDPVLQFQETPVAPAPVATSDEAAVASAVADLPQPVEAAAPVAPSLSSSTSSDLDGIKNDALQELRPLIDRVDLPAEEKYDTYLMLIRSTDDSTLIAPAFAAAQNISDETRRAEALLDIIKEIDYLSRGGQQPTV